MQPVYTTVHCMYDIAFYKQWKICSQINYIPGHSVADAGSGSPSFLISLSRPTKLPTISGTREMISEAPKCSETTFSWLERDQGCVQEIDRQTVTPCHNCHNRIDGISGLLCGISGCLTYQQVSSRFPENILTKIQYTLQFFSFNKRCLLYTSDAADE